MDITDRIWYVCRFKSLQKLYTHTGTIYISTQVDTLKSKFIAKSYLWMVPYFLYDTCSYFNIQEDIGLHIDPNTQLLHTQRHIHCRHILWVFTHIKQQSQMTWYMQKLLILTNIIKQKLWQNFCLLYGSSLNVTGSSVHCKYSMNCDVY